MGDAPSAIQEALQRARQLAAKITQNAPHIKRTASELEDHSIGTVKVTLAYEKPANQASDNNNHRSSSSSNHHTSREAGSDRRDSSRSSRERDRSDREHNRERDRSRDKDRSDRNSREPSEYSGGSSSYGRGFNNNNSASSQSGYGDNGAGSNEGGFRGGNQSESKIEIIIPHAVIGLVIGKGGENIKRIQNETRAIVRVDPSTVDEKGNKVCTITGSKQAVEEAHNQVTSVIENAANNKRPRTSSAAFEGADSYKMKIPAYRTGAIIGKGGETIKSIKQQSGCDIELDRNAKECGPEESIFIIKGTQDKILRARAMIEARLAARGRDSDNSGGRPAVGGSGGSSMSKGLATGANAAPVAQLTDLPTGYQAAAAAAQAGQQTSADVSAAWAAYFAQYSNMFNQTGAQPGAAPGAPAGMPYGAAPGMLAGMSHPQLPTTDHQQQQTQQQQQPPQQQPPQQPLAAGGAKTQGQQQDYTEQWIEFYLMNGRPDYAEQIREMKKQQQQQGATQQKTPQV